MTTSARTPGLWVYRPYEADAWGTIRAIRADGSYSDAVAYSRSGRELSVEERQDHLARDDDPYATNGAFIVQACNSHDVLQAEVEALRTRVTMLREAVELLVEIQHDFNKNDVEDRATLNVVVEYARAVLETVPGSAPLADAPAASSA